MQQVQQLRGERSPIEFCSIEPEGPDGRTGIPGELSGWAYQAQPPNARTRRQEILNGLHKP